MNEKIDAGYIRRSWFARKLDVKRVCLGIFLRKQLEWGFSGYEVHLKDNFKTFYEDEDWWWFKDYLPKMVSYTYYYDLNRDKLEAAFVGRTRAEWRRIYNRVLEKYLAYFDEWCDDYFATLDNWFNDD